MSKWLVFKNSHFDLKSTLSHSVYEVVQEDEHKHEIDSHENELKIYSDLAIAENNEDEAVKAHEDRDEIKTTIDKCEQIKDVLSENIDVTFSEECKDVQEEENEENDIEVEICNFEVKNTTSVLLTGTLVLLLLLARRNKSKN